MNKRDEVGVLKNERFTFLLGLYNFVVEVIGVVSKDRIINVGVIYLVTKVGNDANHSPLYTLAKLSLFVNLSSKLLSHIG